MSIKRSISILLIFSIVMTSFAMTVFAEETLKTEDASYERAISLVSALKIMEGKSENDFAADDFLTRAEMSTIAIRFIGLDLSAIGGHESSYTDVDDSHWGKDYIGAATAFDIVQGNGDGTFLPEESVTVEQAVKMLVCALGYEPKALTRGGYPDGYIAVASELKLLRGADISEGYSAPIKRWQTAILVANALEAELMEVKVYGDESYSAVSKGITALEKYHDVLEDNGTVVSAYGTSINGKDSNINEATIDDTEYTTELNIGKYLGYNVDFYYKKGDGSERGEIIAFFPRAAKSDRVEIDFDDVAAVTVTLERSVQIEYYEDGKARSEKATVSDPVIVYNGKAEIFESSGEAQEFINSHMRQGQLVFLKNKKNNAKDVLFIENYEAYVVSDVLIERRIIAYDIYTAEGVKRGELDFSSAEDLYAKDNLERKTFFYDADDSEIIMGDLMIGDVIMVYSSTDGLTNTIYRSKKRMSGTINRTEKLSREASVLEQASKGSEELGEFETISEIDFSNMTVTGRPNGNSSWRYESNGLASDGHKYSLYAVAYGSNIGFSTGAYDINSLSTTEFGGLKTKTLPEVSNGTLFRYSRETFNNNWGAHYHPPRTATLWLRDIFDKAKVKLGDTVRVTMWVYTDNIWDGDTKTKDGIYRVFDQQGTTTGIRMWLSEESNTDNLNLGYNSASPVNSSEAFVSDEFVNNKWNEISFEYKVNASNKKAAGIRMDASGNSMTLPYPKETFIAGVKVERAAGGGGEEVVYDMPADKTQHKLYIDGVGFEPVRSLYTSLINFDEEVTLLLDTKDKIAGFVQGHSKSQYGLLMDVGVKESPFGTRLQIKVLEQDNVFRIYETTEQVKAWDGAQVTKVDATSLITDKFADPISSHYLWSTRNHINLNNTIFSNITYTWLSDETKSDAANRKIIYYETNTKGEIHKIIVPSIPEDNPECKVKMLQDFYYTGPGWNNISHIVSGRILHHARGNETTGAAREEVSYVASNNAVVYEVFPMNYDDADYSVVKGGISSLTIDNVYDNMQWNNAQLYRYPNSDTVDFMVINPRYPYRGSENFKLIVVESIGETVDGCTLEGFHKGKPYSAPIRKDTRLMEQLILTDKTPGSPFVTKEMLPQLAEEGVKPWRVAYESDAMGNQETPFVSSENVFPGDIVRVLERDNGEIVHFEIARRKSTGLVSMENGTNPTGGAYASLLQWNACVRGEVVDKDPNLETISVKGYYFDGPQIIPSITLEQQSSYPVTEFTTFVRCGTPWIYDFETGQAYPGTMDDIEPGDEVITWSYIHLPKDVLVLKNAQR